MGSTSTIHVTRCPARKPPNLSWQAAQPYNDPLFHLDILGNKILQPPESPRFMVKNWTKEEEEYIRQHFLVETYGDLAEHFGVTTKAMESKIRRMGLKKQELLAETADLPEPVPIVVVEEEPVPEEPLPAPIQSIHTLQRRTEVFEETRQERQSRLESTQKAAEREKARREESRADATVAKALKKFEAGVRKMLAGKDSQALADFRAILDDPPPDIGLTTRTRQYVGAIEARCDTKETPPKTADDFYNLGVVQLNGGDLVAAIETLGLANEKAPKDDRVSYVLAAALARSGDFDAALAALARAIDLNDANRFYAGNDSDFVPLRVHDGFQELIASAEETEEPV